jgi:hypothetical protein
MSKTQSQPQATQAMGLDIGTSRIVSARRSDNTDRFEAQLNAFVTIPHSKLTENSLKRENVPHAVIDSQIIIYGNESARMADLLGQEIRRPMTRGTLNPGEPESLVQMEAIIGSVLKDVDRNTKVCFSVPAPPLGSDENLTFHEATIKQVLKKLGFEDVRSINEGVAVIYGELEDTNYTGIGVSCGGGLCNVAVSYLSVPVLSFSIPKGGDYIDQSAASVTGELINRVRMTKEEGFHFNGHYTDKIRQALTVYYEDMIEAVVEGLKDAFASTRNVPKVGRAVPLVLSGGGVLPQGFREKFEKGLKESHLPIPLSEVRLAPEPLYSTAKGALVSALSE